MNIKFSFLLFVCLAFGSTLTMASTAIDSESNILIQFNEPYDVCHDEQVQISPLVTGGSGSYTYQWSNGDISPATNAPQFPGSQVFGTYQYMLTVTDGVGCSEVASVSYNILESVTHTLFASADFACIDGTDDNVDICAIVGTGLQNGPFTYTWNINSDLVYTINNNCVFIDDENSQPGLFEINLEVTDLFGCSYMEGPFFFTIEQNPDIMIVPPVCLTDGSTNVEYMIEVCDDNGLPAEWYLYDESCSILLDGPFTGECVNFVVSPFNFGDSTSVSYCISAESLSTGCTSFQSFTVDPPAIPNVPQSIEGCFGQDIEITLENPEDFEEWRWCDGVSSDTTFQLTILGNESCFISVVDYNGCDYNYEIEINTPFVGAVEIFGDTQFCLGGSTTLCATSNPDFQYNWSTGETTECIVVTAAGAYFVEVNVDGCTALQQIQVSEISELTPIIFGSDLCLGSSTILSTGNNYTSYEWTNSNGDVIQPSSPTEPWQIEITEPGTYSVNVSNGSCDGDTQFTVDGIEPPSGSVSDGVICNSADSGMETSIDLETLLSDDAGPVLILDSEGNGVPANTFDAEGLESGVYGFSVTFAAMEPCENPMLDFFVEVIDCTSSTINVIPFEISILPNPTSGKIFIDSEKTELNYQILNVSGIILEEGTSTNNEIHFEQMESGIYFIKFSKDGRTRVERVVKI